MTDLATAFAPIVASPTVSPEPDDWRPIMPVPDDAPAGTRDTLFSACPLRLRRDGYVFSSAWAYRDADERVLGYIVRLDRAADGETDKQIVPITYCEGPGGQRRFHPKGFPTPRPLYGANLLAKRPNDPVLILEGEKAAKEGWRRFPGYVGITSPGGGKAARKADWSALRGRHVTIVPDNDAPGEAYAADVAEMAHAAGAASVRIAELPDGLPQHWDIADPLPAGLEWVDIETSVANAATVAAPQSDMPLPLFQPLPPADPFPVDALGPLAAAAKAIANKIQTPVAIAAQSVLAAASLAAQAHADVRLPFGQVRPLSLFFATVAESGARKTSADTEALWPIYRREKNLREVYGEEMKTWRIAHAAWMAEKKKIEGNSKIDFSERKQRLEGLGPEPNKPLAPFIVTGDMTPDGLTKNWAEAHAALGIFSAEGGVFTGSHGMADDNKLRTAAMLSELWDGKPVKRIRAMDGVTILPGRRLAMHIMVQPEAAAQFLSDGTLRDQGMLSRVLVAAPPSLAGQRFYREADDADQKVILAYGARVLSILERPARMAEGKRNELEPHELIISPEATAIWRDFFDHVELMLGKEEDVRGVQDFAAKAAEHAARIAGVLTVYEGVTAAEIGEDAMACAVELASYYVGEALRLQKTGRTNPRLLLAQRLLDWMRGTGNSRITFRDILQYGPGPTRTKEAAEAALAILTSHGWVEEALKRPRTFALKAGG